MKCETVTDPFGAVIGAIERSEKGWKECNAAVVEFAGSPFMVDRQKLA